MPGLLKDQVIKPSLRLQRYRYVILGLSFTGLVLLPGVLLIGFQNPKVVILGKMLLGSGIVIFSFLFFWYPRYTLTMEYHVGKGNLSLVGGIWWRTVKYIPYSKITEITEVQGPLERRFGFGRLQVRTASMISYPEAVLEGIEDLGGVKKLLLTQIENHNARHS